MKLLKKFIKFECFDSLLSYFIFTTLVFASVSFLLMTRPEHMWWLIAMQAIYYIVVIAFTVLTNFNEESRRTRKLKLLYSAFFLTIVVVGCMLNCKYHLLTTTIVFGMSFIFSKLRQCQKFKYKSDEHKILTALSKVFRSRVFYSLSRVFFIFSSSLLFGIFWLQIPTIHIITRSAIFGIYLFLLPMLGVFEGAGQAAEEDERAYMEEMKRREKEPPTDC